MKTHYNKLLPSVKDSSSLIKAKSNLNEKFTDFIKKRSAQKTPINNINRNLAIRKVHTEITLKNVQRHYGKEWNDLKPDEYMTPELTEQFEKIKDITKLENANISVNRIKNIINEITKRVFDVKHKQHQIKIAERKAEEEKRKENERAVEDANFNKQEIPDICKDIEPFKLKQTIGFYVNPNKVKQRRDQRWKTQAPYSDTWFMLTSPTDTSTTSPSFRYYIGEIDKIQNEGKPTEKIKIRYDKHIEGQNTPISKFTWISEKDELIFFANDFPKADYYYQKYIKQKATRRQRPSPWIHTLEEIKSKKVNKQNAKNTSSPDKLENESGNTLSENMKKPNESGNVGMVDNFLKMTPSERTAHLSGLNNNKENTKQKLLNSLYEKLKKKPEEVTNPFQLNAKIKKAAREVKELKETQ